MRTNDETWGEDISGTGPVWRKLTDGESIAGTVVRAHVKGDTVEGMATPLTGAALLIDDGDGLVLIAATDELWRIFVDGGRAGDGKRYLITRRVTVPTKKGGTFVRYTVRESIPAPFLPVSDNDTNDGEV